MFDTDNRRELWGGILSAMCLSFALGCVLGIWLRRDQDAIAPFMCWALLFTYTGIVVYPSKSLPMKWLGCGLATIVAICTGIFLHTAIKA
jgi:hypothetical protein